MTKLSISEQCRRAGIDRKTYYYRLRKGEQDLFAPSNRKKPQFITPELAELLKKNGISKHMYHNRIYLGWTVFEASNVLPNSDVYTVNGKSVHSQLSKSKYCNFIHLINDRGMSVEDAFNKITN